MGTICEGEFIMKVIMILTNGFAPDLRVYKEAQYITSKGYEVEILCWDREAMFKKKPTEQYGNIKITRFFGFMFKALHSSLSNNLSLSTANNPAPIAPQNSGLSDMKIFVFNRFCNTFFKNVFSGR